MTRQVLISTAAAVLALLIVTCGPAGVARVRDAMIEELDAGTLPDGARVVIDGAAVVLDAADPLTPDASAQSYEGTCEEHTYNIEYPDGVRYQRQTHWSATVTVPGLDASAINTIDTVLCDYEHFGAEPMWGACPEGHTCTETGGYPFPRVDCNVGSGAQIIGDTIRVYCGSRTEFQFAAPPAEPMHVSSGSRARSVRIIVR
jgi:hypothetical protein